MMSNPSPPRTGKAGCFGSNSGGESRFSPRTPHRDNFSGNCGEVIDQESKGKTACEQAAEAWGIDLFLLESSFNMSPTERMDAHQRAFELMQILQEAGNHERHKTTSSASPTTSC